MVERVYSTRRNARHAVRQVGSALARGERMAAAAGGGLLVESKLESRRRESFGSRRWPACARPHHIGPRPHLAPVGRELLTASLQLATPGRRWGSPLALDRSSSQAPQSPSQASLPHSSRHVALLYCPLSRMRRRLMVTDSS